VFLAAEHCWDPVIHAIVMCRYDLVTGVVVGTTGWSGAAATRVSVDAEQPAFKTLAEPIF
jgi:hypothetical protein